MPANDLGSAIHRLRRAALLDGGAGLTDGQLLDRFVSGRDPAAIEALVRRHAPMVWGTVRRVLRDHHDAEDAFQATFLVLARKAASVVPRELVANWLYGVARQTALKARATAARRRGRERQVERMPEPAVAEQDRWDDLLPLLDQELSRLPDAYRVVTVLCDLEGKTRREAAGQLGLPEGTVASRLARGRALLAKRLAGRGVVLSAGALAAVLSQQASSAVVPTSVVSATIKAVRLLAAGQAAATGAITVKVAALTEGVLKSMVLTKVKTAIVVLLLAVAGLGGGGVLYHAKAAETAKARNPVEQRAQKQANSEASTDQPLPTPRGRASVTLRAFIEGNAFWTLTDVDTKNNTISVKWAGRMSLEGLAVAADAKVLLDGKQRRLADLRKGMWVTPKVAAGKPQVTMIVTTTKEADLYVLSAVNTENSSITVTLGNFNVTLPVAKDAKIVIGNKGSRLADLRTGMPIFLTLAPVGDRMAATSIRAEQ
jgi:RNA polymerase sigma factor (sigma-70 family)